MDLQQYSHDCFSKNIENFVWFPKQYLLGFFILENFLTGVSCFSITLFYSTLLGFVYTVVRYRTSIRIYIFFCAATQALFITKLVRYHTFILCFWSGVSSSIYTKRIVYTVVRYLPYVCFFFAQRPKLCLYQNWYDIIFEWCVCIFKRGTILDFEGGYDFWT